MKPVQLEHIWVRLQNYLPTDMKEFVLDTFDECFQYSVSRYWDHVIAEVISIMHWRNIQHKEPIKVKQVKSKFGSLRFYVQGYNDDYLYGAIAMAEIECSKICPHCGAYNKQKLRTGRYNTKCTECPL